MNRKLTEEENRLYQVCSFHMKIMKLQNHFLKRDLGAHILLWIPTTHNL